MSVTHSSFTIERRCGCTPRQALSAFADPELLDALERFLAGEPVR